MRKTVFIFTLIFCAALPLFSQQSISPILLKVGGEVTSLEEFREIFMKNKMDQSVTKGELDDYIELFVKFKLKVKEAKELGMDTTKAFRQELDMYRKQLAQPYLKVTDVEDQLLQEAYTRLQKDVKVRQIVIKLPSCPSPADTLAAFKKAEAIRKEILKTKNFEDAVKKYSQDSITAAKGGLVGWLTALQSAYAFENAFYGLKAGEISQPVKTSQGYHILKADEIRPAVGNVKVAHIFISSYRDNPALYTEAKKRIDEAYTKIKNGEEFDDVCAIYSEDYNTNQKGGVLAPFGINKMQPLFEEKAFALKSPGDVSEVFETNLGFHLIKLVEKVPVPEFEKLKGELFKEVQKSNRWAVTKQTLVNQIKNTYGFSINTPLLDALRAHADQNGGNIEREFLKNYQGGWLFKIGNNEYSYADFVADSYSRIPADKPLQYCNFTKNYLDIYVDNKLMEFKEANLENEDPKFKTLMNEYRDGILLFNLMDKKVWTKSVEDSIGLKNFYEGSKTNYMWGERADVYLVDCIDATVEKAARKLAPKLQNGKITKAKFIESLNKSNSGNIILTEGLYSKGDNVAVDNTGFVPGIGSTTEYNGKLRFAIVKNIEAPRPKALKEAKGLIISDYQAFLEMQWVKDLMAKYPVQLDNQVLYQLIR